MDTLMSNYGLNKQQQQQQQPQNTSSQGYSNAPVLQTSPGSSSSNNQFKKQLTLSEKQEMASRLEKEFDTSKNMPSSTSMSGIKSNAKPSIDLLTDSLMDRNLADMNINKPATQFANNSNNNTSQMSFANTNSIRPSGFNQFNNQNNFRPAMNTNMNNSQMGFFGNLALPAPPSATQPSSQPMNLMSPTSTPALIPPPPNRQNQNQQFGNQSLINMSANQSANKKPTTALDDLQDIFG